MKLRIFDLLCDLAIRRGVVKGLCDFQEHCGGLEGLGGFPTTLSAGGSGKGGRRNKLSRSTSFNGFTPCIENPEREVLYIRAGYHIILEPIIALQCFLPLYSPPAVSPHPQISLQAINNTHRLKILHSLRHIRRALG